MVYKIVVLWNVGIIYCSNYVWYLLVLVKFCSVILVFFCVSIFVYLIINKCFNWIGGIKIYFRLIVVKKNFVFGWWF